MAVKLMYSGLAWPGGKILSRSTVAGWHAGAAALGDASDTTMAHPLALQLRNLQSQVRCVDDQGHWSPWHEA
jgi:hypothetical protein